MKMTVELPDALLEEARAIAERKGLTLRDLIEEGLRQSIRRETPPGRFRLKDGTFTGTGMNPQFRDAPWEKIRDAIYGIDETEDGVDHE